MVLTAAFRGSGVGSPFFSLLLLTVEARFVGSGDQDGGVGEAFGDAAEGGAVELRPFPLLEPVCHQPDDEPDVERGEGRIRPEFEGVVGWDQVEEVGDDAKVEPRCLVLGSRRNVGIRSGEHPFLHAGFLVRETTADVFEGDSALGGGLEAPQGYPVSGGDFGWLQTERRDVGGGEEEDIGT
ncbi:hypothetical protein KC367_g69 [Hortaea werneckii]|nr:hypothetical protein KC367_g69 [Hortaea werneckii]